MKLYTFVGLVVIITTSSAWVTAQTFSPSDPESAVTFTIKNFGLNVDGKFSGLSGTINFDPYALENSLFIVKVESNSINTGIDLRDNHLKKKEFLDAERYPYIHFMSTKVSHTDKQNVYHINGKLTIKGISKEVEFNFSVTDKINTLEFKGGFKIDRRDFNVGGNSLSMSDNVEIKLQVIAHALVD